MQEAESVREIIGWAIALFATNGIIIIGAILGWIYQGKKNKRDLKATDYENAKKRLDALKALQEYGDEQTLEKLSLQEQIHVLNARLWGVECWARCLTEQLKDNDIIPYTMEEAIERNCR